MYLNEFSILPVFDLVYFLRLCVNTILPGLCLVAFLSTLLVELVFIFGIVKVFFLARFRLRPSPLKVWCCCSICIQYIWWIWIDLNSLILAYVTLNINLFNHDKEGKKTFLWKLKCKKLTGYTDSFIVIRNGQLPWKYYKITLIVNRKDIYKRPPCVYLVKRWKVLTPGLMSLFPIKECSDPLKLRKVMARIYI